MHAVFTCFINISVCVYACAQMSHIFRTIHYASTKLMFLTEMSIYTIAFRLYDMDDEWHVKFAKIVLEI